MAATGSAGSAPLAAAKGRFLTLVLGLLLDAWLGEPGWLWRRFAHPAVLMGRCVGWLDRTFNCGRYRRLRGILGFACLCFGFVGLGLALAAIPGPFVDIVVLAMLLAQRSLVQHVAQVASALRQSVPAARTAVAQIVGRDTQGMDTPAIARAAIESAAENLSDAVIAPAFWFALFGLPGLLLYKITNTADSMIGYRTARYAEFGWAAARFDDLLNLIPARLTAALIWATVPRRAAWPAIMADAPRHRSPNAGWPEAAMAQVLGIALSGPRSYGGEQRDDPYVNAAGRRQAGAADIDAACHVLWRAWGLGVLAAVTFALF